MLVQRAINFLDYSAWKRVLTAAGLTAEMVTMWYKAGRAVVPFAIGRGQRRLGLLCVEG